MKRLNLPKRCKIGKFTLVVDFYKNDNFDQVFGLFARSMKDSRGKSSHPQDMNNSGRGDPDSPGERGRESVC